MRTSQQREIWLNDHLDLYNYACEIGDSDWQEELMATIRNGPPSENDETDREERQRKLWQEYHVLNNKLLELFSLLKTSKSDFESQGILRLMWALKSRRLEVGRRLVL